MDQDSTKSTPGSGDKRNWRDRLGVGGGLPKLSEEFQAQGNAQRAEPRLDDPPSHRTTPPVRPGAPVARPAPMAPRVPSGSEKRQSAPPLGAKADEAQRIAPTAYPLQRATVQRPQAGQVGPPSQSSASAGKDAFSERLKAQREAAERMAQQRLAAARERSGQTASQAPARPAAQPARPIARAEIKPQAEGSPRFNFADEEIAAAQRETRPEAARQVTAERPRQVARAPLPHASPGPQPRTGAGANRPAAQPEPEARRDMPAYPPPRRAPLVSYEPNFRPPAPGLDGPAVEAESGGEHRSRRRAEEPRLPRGDGKRGRVGRARAHEDDDDFDGVFDAPPSALPLKGRSGAAAYSADYGEFEDEYEQEEPRRRGGPIVLLLSLLAFVAVAGGVLYWYQTSERGAPATADLPVIPAPQQPVKAEAEPLEQPELANQQIGRKQIYDRILGEETLEPERIVPTEEEPQTEQLGQQGTPAPQPVQPPQAATPPAAGQGPTPAPSEATDGEAAEPQPIPLPPPPGTGQQGDLLPPKSDDAQQTAAVSVGPAAQRIVPEPAASTPDEIGQVPQPEAEVAAAPAVAAPAEATPPAEADTRTASLEDPETADVSDMEALIERETGDAGPKQKAETGATTEPPAARQGSPPLPKPKPKLTRKVGTKSASQASAKKPAPTGRVARGGPVQIMPPQLAQPAGQTQPVARPGANLVPAGQTQPAVPPGANLVPAEPEPNPTAPLRSKNSLPEGRGASIESPSHQPPVQQAAFVPPQRPENASGGEGYVVQLASFRSETDALNEYKRLTQRHSGLVGGLEPRVKEASLGPNAMFYRLNIGPLADKTAATKLCNSLIAAGEKDCLVRRF